MRRRDATREVGTDPNAYRERVVTEAIRSNPEYARRAEEAIRRGGRSLPSVNQNSHGMDDQTDDDLIELATKSKSNPWA
jgi:hypothetical protein